MRRMTVADLRGKYAAVFGEQTRCRHKGYLVRRIAWRLQANVEGGLTERARKRATELAATADIRLTAPRQKAVTPTGPTKVATIHISQDGRLPMPGATITRECKGQAIEVDVLPDGFDYEGEVYRTLSAVATKSFSDSCVISSRTFRKTWTSTWSSTTTPPTSIPR